MPYPYLKGSPTDEKRNDGNWNAAENHGGARTAVLTNDATLNAVGAKLLEALTFSRMTRKGYSVNFSSTTENIRHYLYLAPRERIGTDTFSLRKIVRRASGLLT